MPSQDSRAVDALSKSDVKSEAENTPIGDVDEFKTPPTSPNAKKTSTCRQLQEKQARGGDS